jgi:hypothetical protein
MQGCRRPSANLCGKGERNFFTECLTLPGQIALNRDRPKSHQIIPSRFKWKRVTRGGLVQRGSGKNRRFQTVITQETLGQTIAAATLPHAKRAGEAPALQPRDAEIAIVGQAHRLPGETHRARKQRWAGGAPTLQLHNSVCCAKQDEAANAVRRAFSKVSSWRTPPHWSRRDWLDEALTIGRRCWVTAKRLSQEEAPSTAPLRKRNSTNRRHKRSTFNSVVSRPFFEILAGGGSIGPASSSLGVSRELHLALFPQGQSRRGARVAKLEV